MAVDVPGQFYRAMSESREGVASTSSLYTEDSVRSLACTSVFLNHCLHSLNSQQLCCAWKNRQRLQSLARA